MPSERILWTGQTSCYDARGARVGCAGTGQDGAYGAGRRWPVPRFRRDGALVEDALTGLVWTADANLAGFPLSWAEARAFVETMNREAAFGFRDWRLANRRELRSLVCHQNTRPALPEGHPFENLFPHWYWTSTPSAIAPGHAWYVHFDGGRMFYGALDEQHMLWPVRGVGEGLFSCTEDEGGRYVARGDVVRDTLSGREWTRSADLAQGVTDWEGALEVVAALNRAERRDDVHPWRLASINELESLVDCTRADPALACTHPFRQVREAYWSATTSTYEPSWAWALYMRKGAVGVGYKGGAHFHVWAVRMPWAGA